MRAVGFKFLKFVKKLHNISGLLTKISDFFLRSIRRKLVFVFLMLIILPISILSIISYKMLQDKVKDKINTANYAAIQQTDINLERILSDMLTATNTLIMDEDIITILKNAGPQNTAQFYANGREIMEKITIVQNSILDYYQPTAIIITDKYKHAYSSLENQATDVDVQFNELKHKEVANSDEKYNGNYLKWGNYLHKFDLSERTGPSNSIVLIRSYFDPNTIEKIGDLAVVIPETKFSTILKSLAMFNNSKAYLVNENGLILSSSDEMGLNSKLNFYHLLSKVSTTKPVIIKSNGINEMINVQTIDRNGWMIIQEIPYNVFFSEFSVMRNRIIYIDLAFLLLFLGISYFMARSISNPINSLNAASKELASGNFNVRVSVTGRDEVKDLALSFNHMASDIKGMLKQINDDEKTKRELELQVLYAQINPHFLFNTLNSIRWMADASRVFNVSKMIVALASLLRSSILKNDEVITVREEIEYVKNYILIQKMRFASAFEDEYDISEDILEHRTLKLILQPIVENTIIHGFAGISHKGIVRISGRIENNRIILTVADNGIGMDEESIEKLLKSKSNIKGNFSGIGISNVNERLILHFGGEYALKVEGKLRVGTSVQITIPVSF